MINLVGTSQSLEVLLSGAITTNALQWSISYRRVGSTSLSCIPSNNVGLVSGTTMSCMVSGASSSQVDEIESLSVFNSDTVIARPTIRINTGGAFTTLAQAPLQINEALYYDGSADEGGGWYVGDSTLARKSAVSITSGQIQSGNISNNAVNSGNIASGSVGWAHLGNPIPVGICEGRLSLDYTTPISSQDVISLSSISGTILSGTSLIQGVYGISGTYLSGRTGYITPGMIVITASGGLDGGTWVVGVSGTTGAFGSGVIRLNKISTSPVSGPLSFVPSLFLVPYNGNRVTTFDSTGGFQYRSFGNSTYSGAIRILSLDNAQGGIFASGSTLVSGLTDSFQLQRGMTVRFTGVLGSGTAIASIEGAGNITLTKAAISGAIVSMTSGSSINLVPHYGLPVGSGAIGSIGSGFNWDVLVTVRSGTPWLQYSNQWTTLTTKLDAITR